MTARTYDELFASAKPRLTLEESLSGKFTCVDESGRIYFYPSTRDMDVVVRFMRAMALKGHATLDEESITYFGMRRQVGAFSVGVGTLSERGSTESGHDGGPTVGLSLSKRASDSQAPLATLPPRSESVQKVEGEPEAGYVSRAVLGEPASPSTSVAGKGGVGTDGVSPSDRGGCAAAPAPISPPHLRLVS